MCGRAVRNYRTPWGWHPTSGLDVRGILAALTPLAAVLRSNICGHPCSNAVSAAQWEGYCAVPPEGAPTVRAVREA